MPYPLEVGGVDDYRIKVGSMLLTMVDPNRGYEVAYNRWYERDHFYAGCMIGPFLFAGSRWVATRALKDARWPSDDETDRVAARRGFVRRDLLGREGSSRRSLRRVGAPSGARALRGGPRLRRAQAHAHGAVRPPRRGVPRHRPRRGADRARARPRLRRTRHRVARRARRARRAPRCTTSWRVSHAPELLGGFADRDRQLVDAVGGRERSARRPDGSRQQGRRTGAAVPAAVRVGRRAATRCPRSARTPTRSKPPTSRPLRLVAPFFRTVVGTDRYVDELW